MVSSILFLTGIDKIKENCKEILATDSHRFAQIKKIEERVTKRLNHESHESNE